jgi:DNA repair protein RadC
MKVPLTREQKIRVFEVEDVYKIMQQILLRENKIGRGKEHFWVVCLSSMDRIMLIELLGLGTENATLVDPTEVFSFALQKQAKTLIMVHNHPHENMLIPSPADMDLTNHMYQVGKFLNLPVIDHLIINEKKFLSFAETGVLERLAKSKKYALQYKEEAERLMQKGREEGIKIGIEKGVEIGVKKGEKLGIQKGRKEGRQEGELNKAIQMAKAMMKKGVEVKLIADVSKLSINQIRKL